MFGTPPKYSQRRDIVVEEVTPASWHAAVEVLLSQAEEEVEPLPRAKQSFDIDEEESPIAVVALRCERAVWEVYRGRTSDEDARALGRALAVGAGAQRELENFRGGWRFARDGKFVGAAYFFRREHIAAAVCVAEESVAAAQSLCLAVAETKGLADLAFKARCDGDDYAAAAVGDELRRVLHRQVDRETGYCANCCATETLENLLVCGGVACAGLLCRDCRRQWHHQQLDDDPVVRRRGVSDTARCRVVYCRVCDARKNARRVILDTFLQNPKEFCSLLGDLLGDVASSRGLIGRTTFATVLCGAAQVDDNDDPVLLGDAFDAADQDHDGFVDFFDIVKWLKKNSEDDDDDDDDDSSDDEKVVKRRRSQTTTTNLEWPSLEPLAAALNNQEVFLSLSKARLRLESDAGMRTAAVHPRVMAVKRVAATRLAVSTPCAEDVAIEETLNLDFENEDDCAATLEALAATLAMGTRFDQDHHPILDQVATAKKRRSLLLSTTTTQEEPSSPVTPASSKSFSPRADDDGLDDDDDDDDDSFQAVAAALDDVFITQRPQQMRKNDDEDPRPALLRGSYRPRQKRRSVRFSDADEIEVSRGWAFDRVTASDGSVSWEPAAPRRAKEAYRAVVKLVIRPPRADYCVDELGPRTFELSSGGKEMNPRVKVDNVLCLRSDFQVIGSNDRKLSASFWTRFDDVGEKKIALCPVPRTIWRGKRTGPSYFRGPKIPSSSSEDEKPCILYSHGNASCRLEALPHVAPFLLLGISVCAFDSAGSGHSDGEYVTLGHREAEDVAAVGRHLVATGRASKIALYGRSMGAVAAILAAARHADFGGLATCVCADSPFASLTTLVDALARSAAYTAFRAPIPQDLTDAAKPIDNDFARETNGLAAKSSGAPKRKKAQKSRGKKEEIDEPQTSEWIPSVLMEAFPSARAALADAAARAAVESVTAEVKRRANFDLDAVDVMSSIDSLDTPLFLIAAEDDLLVPARSNAGEIIKAYFAKRSNVSDSYRRHRLEAQLILCNGGHNAKRPGLVLRKAYYFLVKFLFDLKDNPKALRDKIQVLFCFHDIIDKAKPPWRYNLDDDDNNIEEDIDEGSPIPQEEVRTPDAPKNPEFDSGFSDTRHRRAVKEISNLFAQF